MGGGGEGGGGGRGADHDPALIELTCDALEQGPGQAAAHQLGADADKGGAVRRGLVRSEAAKAPERGAVVESFGQAHVGKVVPGCQQEGSEQASGGQPGSPLAEAEMPDKQAIPLGPVDQSGHLVQRRAAAWFSPAQRQLLLPDLAQCHGRFPYAQASMESDRAAPDQPPAHRSHYTVILL